MKSHDHFDGIRENRNSHSETHQAGELHPASAALPKREKHKMAAAAVIAALAIVLAVVYIAGVLFFRSHYLPHTSVGFIDAGTKSPADVTRELRQRLTGYTLTVKAPDGSRTAVKASDIGFSYGTKDPGQIAAAALKSQNALAWPAGIFSSHDYDLVVSYDKDALRRELDPILSKPQTASNAAITFSDDGYQITDAVYGVKPDEVLRNVEGALKEQKEAVTLKDADFVVPEVTADSKKMKDAVSQIKHFEKAQISYHAAGKNPKLDAKRIDGLLTISDNYEVSVSDDAIMKFVHDLAAELNTYGDVRTVHTQMGDDIQLGGGTYGWVVNKKAEAARIREDLEAGKPVTREPVWEQTAAGPIGDDIGSSYLEIDYTNQKFWYVKDGQAVYSSDIVSGNMSKGTGSPDGFYKINYKQSPATLVGEDYTSPVTYFNVFAYNVGFHDASWRSTFGGTIYKTSGSHGCINLPLEAAKYIYENVPKDTPVVAYYREKVSLTADNTRISNAYSYDRSAAEASDTSKSSPE